MTAPTYDTGLGAPQRTLIRNALVERLQPLLRANGGFLRKIGTLPWTIRSKSDDDIGWLVQAIDSQTPAIIVALGRRDFESIGTFGLEWNGPIEVVVYCASSNARSVVDGRLAGDAAAAIDPTADPGIEAMLEIAMRQIILGQDLDIPTTHEFRAASEEEVYTFMEYTLWEQRYTVEVQVDINPDRAVTTQVGEIDVANNLDTDGATDLTVETLTTLEAP